MERPRKVNWAIAIGVFCAAAIALYCTVWFAAPQYIRALQPGDPGYDL